MSEVPPGKFNNDAALAMTVDGSTSAKRDKALAAIITVSGKTGAPASTIVAIAFVNRDATVRRSVSTDSASVVDVMDEVISVSKTSICETRDVRFRDAAALVTLDTYSDNNDKEDPGGGRRGCTVGSGTNVLVVVIVCVGVIVTV